MENKIDWYKMDRVLHLIKEVHATGSSFTHVALNSGLYYSLDEKKYDHFWNEYCHISEQALETNNRIYLAEIPQLHMPLNIECRFKFHTSRISDVELTDSYLLQLTSHIQKAVDEVFELKSPSELVCCLLDGDHTKQPRSEFTYINYRFHFPYCKSEATFHMTHYFPRLVNILHENNFNLPQMCNNSDWREVIQIRPTEPLPMYGCCESETSPLYTLCAILPSIPYSHIDEESKLENFEVPKETVILKKYHKHLQNIPFDIPLDAMIPVLLSVYFYQGVCSPKPFGVQPSPIRGVTPGTVETMKDIAMRKFMLMIGNHRWTRPDYTIWIGKALYNLTDGSEEGLIRWKQGLEQAKGPCMKPDECDSLYYGFRGNPSTEKTLAWYALEDSPDQYNEWHRTWCNRAVEEAVSGLHSDVAEALYRKYWLIFACTEKGEWYYYKNHRWESNDSGIDLQKKISTEFLNEYLEKIANIARSQQQFSHDSVEFNTREANRKKYDGLIKKLKTTTFKSNIMRECREKFHNVDFMKYKDSNKDTVGCHNGVIELFNHHVFFRPGKPEDYLTFNTNIPYRADFTMEHPLVRKLNKWISQTFTDDELRHYFCKDLSSFLKGKNSEKKLRTWTGEGDNSKSMWVKAMEKALGDYICKLPTSVMEKRGQSSGAAPEMARLANRHGAILQETDSQDSINIGILKELTGGDSFFARSLHQNGNEVEATFKILLMCNKIPSIPNADKATKKRLIIIPFMSQWVHDAPRTEEEQFATRKFPIDINFEYQIPEMSQALLWLMVYYYPIYAREGLETPRIVQEHTMKYWEENDMYLNFCRETIKTAYLPGSEDEIDKTATITSTELYECFKLWYKEAFPGNKIPSSLEFKGQITQRIGRQENRKWVGFHLIQNDIDIPRLL